MKARHISSVILTLFLIITGCNSNLESSFISNPSEFSIDEEKLALTNGLNDIDYDVDYYNNSDLNNIKTGDPFAMRFNGAYYLYSSGSPMRVYKSLDLIHWDLLSDNIAPTFDKPHAYAPEVAYFNGYFYLYTSPNGLGHYILKSKSPEGPFVQVSEKFDTYIDGDVFIDDDEKMYFLHHGGGSIMIGSMPNMETVNTGNYIFVSNTLNTGGQTEGPYILKRNGIYYLSYTGTEVTSKGYRVFYAVSDDADTSTLESFASSFKDGASNPVLLNAEEGKVGLGHSSTVLGPDMDSHYIVYHDIANYGRTLNVDRLLFSGTLMTASNNTSDAVTPKLPDFYSYGKSEQFSAIGDFYLSNTITSKTFTAEFNSKNDQDVKYVFSYTDDNHYNYVKVSYLNHEISLYQVVNGQESLITKGTLQNDFDASDNHEIRIASHNNTVNVYFDNMNKIKNVSLESKAGKIGYLSSNTNLTIGYTAYSHVANGTSDREEVKQALQDVPASSYMIDQFIPNVPSYQFSEGSGLNRLNNVDNIYHGSQVLKLATPYDFARYLVNFKASSTYALSLTLPSIYRGKTIGLEIDGRENLFVTIPNIPTEDDVIHVQVANLLISKGVHQVKLQNIGDEVGLISFDFKPIIENQTFSYGLTSLEQQATYVTNGWVVSENGHLATNDSITSRELLYLSKENVTDFELEVDMSITTPVSGLTSSLGAGIILHGANFANNYRSETAFDDNDSIEGYYIKISRNKITIRKECYKGYSQDLISERIEMEYDKNYRYRVMVEDNTITVYRDGQFVLTYTDALAYTSGKTGFYTTGFDATYSNAKYIIN